MRPGVAAVVELAKADHRSRAAPGPDRATAAADAAATRPRGKGHRNHRPPGAGKSTLVDALISAYRGDGGRPGVLAVDPSSPLTGGAVLGDRVRMHRHAADEGVFIRSMGSRGRSDGLSPTVRDASRAILAAGYDPVIVETVGVGQAELGVVACCDVRILVVTPMSGDYVQAAKAGLTEVVDVVVVNKADRPGAGKFARELRSTARHAQRDIAVVTVTAANGLAGIKEARAAIDLAWRLLCAESLHNRRLEAARG